MKTIMTVVCSISAYILFGQDTTYLDKNYKKLNSRESAEYYEILEFDKDDSSKVVSKMFYKSDQIKLEKHYSSFQKRTIHGKERNGMRMDSFGKTLII